MTIHEASMQLRFSLFHLYDEREAGNITDLVMAHITGWQKIDRIVNKTVPLSAQQQQLLQQYSAALLRHQPVQYVLNEAWFYGMALYVNEQVLIPRPETEELVDWLVKDAGNAKQTGSSVLDIGTGSGCIALAIKNKLPHFIVHACDISEGALQVAKKNAAGLQLNVVFHQLDILSEKARNGLDGFDIIISNPPYIPQRDKTDMALNVLEYEPALALFVENDDPMLFYTAIAAFAKDHLAPGGCIYLEIHEAMGDVVTATFRQYGFRTIEVRQDMQGRSRMVKVG